MWFSVPMMLLNSVERSFVPSPVGSPSTAR